MSVQTVPTSRPATMSGEEKEEEAAEARSGLKRDLLMGLTEHCVADFISNQKGRTGLTTVILCVKNI